MITDTRAHPPIPSFRRAAAPALAAWAAASLLAGCATAIDPGAYRPNPTGTVTSFHRVSSGSFGVSDGPVVWTHESGTWQGREVEFARSPQAGTTVYDRASHGTLATLTPAGQTISSFEPPMGLRYPLAVGQRWSDQHQLTMHRTGSTVPLTVNYAVEAYEAVTVPAGTYQAFRVAITDSFGERATYWVAPSLGLGTVKRVAQRPATHPAGAGQIEGVLTSVKRPG